MLAIIIQPPSPIKLTLANGREWLDNVVRTCAYHDYSVAFEFNHSSWFQDLTFNLLHEHKAAIVWSSFSSKYCSSPVIIYIFWAYSYNIYIYSGQAGGFFAVVSNLIGEMLSKICADRFWYRRKA